MGNDRNVWKGKKSRGKLQHAAAATDHATRIGRNRGCHAKNPLRTSLLCLRQQLGSKTANVHCFLFLGIDWLT